MGDTTPQAAPWTLAPPGTQAAPHRPDSVRRAGRVEARIPPSGGPRSPDGASCSKFLCRGPGRGSLDRATASQRQVTCPRPSAVGSRGGLHGHPDSDVRLLQGDSEPSGRGSGPGSASHHVALALSSGLSVPSSEPALIFQEKSAHVGSWSLPACFLPTEAWGPKASWTSVLPMPLLVQVLPGFLSASL